MIAQSLKDMYKVKNNNIVLLGTFVLLISLFNINLASANTGINPQIPYSGTIINNDGTVLPDPPSGSGYRAKFLIYNVPSGGTALYEEIRDGTTSYAGTGVSPALNVTDGKFEILLGSQNTTDFTNILNDDSLWLELQLDMDNNNITYEEVFAPRTRISSSASAINALRLVAANGGTDNDTLSLDVAGNVIATSLGGDANTSIPTNPTNPFNRVIIANSSGQFSQVNISTLSGSGTSSGWALLGNATTDAWNGSTGTRIGTTTAQPLVLATTNATAQDIRFFTGNNGANERLRITGDGKIGIGTSTPNSLLHVEGVSYYNGIATHNANVVVNSTAALVLGTGDGVASTPTAGTIRGANSCLIGGGGCAIGGNLKIESGAGWLGNGDISLKTDTERLRITGDGKISVEGASYYNGIATHNANLVVNSAAALVLGSGDGGGWPGPGDGTIRGANYNGGCCGITGGNLKIISGGGVGGSGYISFQTNTERLRITGDGNIGIGTSTPTAILQLGASTGLNNTAPLKFTSGTNLTTPEAGALEWNGTNLFLTTSANVRQTINQGLTAIATLDFTSTNNSSYTDLTVTVTGAALNDVVSLGIPNSSVPSANSNYTAWVSATNTVTIRFSNNSGVAQDPASGSFKVFVTKF